MGEIRLITFNGFNLSDYLSIKSIDRGGIIPPREIETESIPQKIGAYKKNVKTGVRIIKAEVKITGDATLSLREKLEVIGDILRTDEDVPIIFNDEPDRTYYGMLQGETNISEVLEFGKGEISFICVDPYKYGVEEAVDFDASDSLIFNNGTNGDIFPRYEILFNAPATFFSILSSEDQITVGEPVEAEVTPVPREQLILTEGFNNMTGWSATNTAVDGGVVAGTISVDANGNFVPTNFGTGEAWHGPALKKSLPEELQDFQLELYLENKSSGTKTDRPKKLGRVELYLLDINDQVIAKFAIRDSYKDYEKTYGDARLGGLSGGKTVIQYTGKPSYWNNFDGRIFVRRIGKQWSILISKWDGKVHYNRMGKEYFDSSSAYSQKVAKVQVHFGAFGTQQTTNMLLDVMRVWKINSVLIPEIPYIVDANDLVVIDTSTGSILKNGDPWMTELDQISNFFSLNPGSTNLEFYPEGVTSSIQTWYRKRWL